MLMPKTAVDEDYLSSGYKNDIGLAWQLFHVEGIPKAH
jgi:hypothetical protein